MLPAPLTSNSPRCPCPGPRACDSSCAIPAPVAWVQSICLCRNADPGRDAEIHARASQPGLTSPSIRGVPSCVAVRRRKTPPRSPPVPAPPSGFRANRYSPFAHAPPLALPAPPSPTAPGEQFRSAKCNWSSSSQSILSFSGYGRVPIVLVVTDPPAVDGRFLAYGVMTGAAWPTISVT